MTQSPIYALPMLTIVGIIVISVIVWVITVRKSKIVIMSSGDGQDKSNQGDNDKNDYNDNHREHVETQV